MAGEQLGTTADLLAGLPDNTSGLIQAVDSRNLVISVVDGVGFWDDNNDPSFPITIPMVADTPTDLFSLFPAPPATVFAGNYYRLDGNNHFVPSYVDDGIIVPPGTLRIVESVIALQLDKVGGGTASYTFNGTKAGVPYLPGRTLDVQGGGDNRLLSSSARLVDVSLAEPLSLTATPNGHSEDLIVIDFRFNVKMVLV